MALTPAPMSPLPGNDGQLLRCGGGLPERVLVDGAAQAVEATASSASGQLPGEATAHGRRSVDGTDDLGLRAGDEEARQIAAKLARDGGLG